MGSEQNPLEYIRYSEWNKVGTILLEEGQDTLYINGQNSTEETAQAVIDLININNSAPLQIGKTGQEINVLIRGYHLNSSEDTGLIELGSEGLYNTAGTVSKGSLDVVGNLSIQDSSSTENLISQWGATLNKTNAHNGANLSVKGNLSILNSQAENSLIFLRGKTEHNDGSAIGVGAQSAQIEVYNNDHTATLAIQDSTALSGIDAINGAFVKADLFDFNGNTFSDYGIRVGSTEDQVEYINHFEVMSAITMTNTTVAGEGTTGNFEALSLNNTFVHVLEDSTNFTQPDGEPYPWKGTGLVINNIDVKADRETVTAVNLVNNKFAMSWGNTYTPSLYMQVSDISVEEGAKVGEIVGLNYSGNIVDDNYDLTLSLDVSNIVNSGDGAIVGAKLTDNYRKSIKNQGSVAFENITIKDLKSDSGEITGIEVSQQNLKDQSVYLQNVNISNLQTEGLTQGVSINDAVVYIGNMNVEADYALKATNSEVTIGDEDFDATQVSLQGRVEMQNTTVETSQAKISVQGTLSLDAGSSMEVKPQLVLVADTERQDQLTGYKDALVINPSASSEGASLEYIRGYPKYDKTLYLSAQGLEDQTYLGYFADDSQDENTVRYGALRVNAYGKADFTQAKSVQIYGTIIAGRGTQDATLKKGGNISIGSGSSENTVVVRGDVFAGNGGEVTMVLGGSNSLIEGQIDDYWELDSVKQGEVFRNTAFSDSNGQLIDVNESGKVNLTLKDGAQWIARGQSFLTSLAFEGEGSVVDLSKNTNSSVVIKDLTGDGTFRMNLDKPVVNESTGEIHSDMLYIQNMDDDAHYVIEIDPSVNVNELNGLRFATTNTTSGLNNFTLAVTNRGIFNRSLTINTEDYSATDEDNKYFNGGDGSGEGSYKPGDEVVTGMFDGDDATNWYIGDPDAFNPDQGGDDNPDVGGETSLSDAGHALLATARGTYWTAVAIDRLTNRMGDARYANNGEDGLWIRLRQSRLGTDTGEGDFKSDNTVYQVGYDHAFQREGGRQLVGIAFDYMDTDLDYKGISGEGNTDRYGVTAYTTWLGDNGFYVDLVGKWGRLDNDFDIVNSSGGQVKADYDNNMWAISAEVGRKLSNPKTGMFIEPNAQIQYTMVTDAQYNTNQGTRVDQDRIDSVIGRMGVRIGRAFGEGQNHNIYAKADVFREFMGEQKIHVRDVTTHVEGDTISVQNKGTWMDVGAGFQSKFTDSTYAYADVEYRFGNDLDESWIVNAGMRYEF